MHAHTHDTSWGGEGRMGERVRNYTNYKANWTKEKLLVNLCKGIYRVLCASPENSLKFEIKSI